MINKLATVMFLLAGGAFLIAAPSRVYGQGPLSPPEKSPIPMSDGDQERARAESLARPKPVVADLPILTPGGHANLVTIPGRHVSSGNALIDAIANEAGARYKIDPCLILSVMNQESGYKRVAVSPKGASGLMQLMPATAVRFGVRDIFDPRENINAGANYLRWVLDRFGGDLRLALAGYNAGEGAVELWGYRIPPYQETQNYVQSIYSRYSRIHGGGTAFTTPLSLQPSSQAGAKEPEKNPTFNQIVRFPSVEPDPKPDPKSRP